MRLKAMLSTVLVLTTLVLGVVSTKSTAATAIFGAAKAFPGSLRMHCGEPQSLHLTRYEDGSAQLKCAGRVLVRVSVPG